MKTGDKFHVEKENYDRLRQSFTERLEKGKNVTQAYPASTKDKSSATHSLIQKGGEITNKQKNLKMFSLHLFAGEDPSEVLEIFSSVLVGKSKNIVEEGDTLQ